MNEFDILSLNNQIDIKIVKSQPLKDRLTTPTLQKPPPLPLSSPLSPHVSLYGLSDLRFNVKFPKILSLILFHSSQSMQVQ